MTLLTPITAPNINIANSLFPGLNDKNGLMLCGYEWGDPKSNQEHAESGVDEKTPIAQHTFANKSLGYGEQARYWRYDRNIIRWFEIWGHRLDEEGIGGQFEQSFVQTNWCNTQAHHITGDYFAKLLAPEQAKNFLFHVEHFRPKVLLFFGVHQMACLQVPSVLEEFERIVGPRKSAPNFVTKAFSGKRFRVGFQTFQELEVVAFPHPSGSRGLSPDYIALFKEEMEPLLSEYKKTRMFQ